MWRPEPRKLALSALVLGIPSAVLLACPTAHAPAIPPGTALIQTSAAALPIPTGEVDASTTVAKRPIRRVDQCSVPPVPAEDGGTIAVDMDVRYGPDERQVLDIAWPVGTSKGLVVIVHGGGWTAGTKKLFHPTIRQLAALGYAAATVNYRLARSAANAFPVGLSDVRCSVREAQALAQKRGIDASRLVVVGASAGGHLAAMLAVDGDDAALDASCERKGAIKLRGAIAYYAPLGIDRAADHYPPKMIAAVDELLRVDAGGDEYAKKARAATPSHYVDPGDAPVLFLHGSDDKIVPVSDSRELAQALEAAGVPSLVVELPGQDHGFFVLGKKETIRPATCTALAFLEDVME